MANNTNDKSEFSKSGQVAEARELWGANPAALLCPKCDASKVATSRPQAGDQLHSLLWPALPYRCLRCYHRFWLKENFFAKKSRVVFWFIVALILVFLAIKAVTSLLGDDASQSRAVAEEKLEVLAPRATPAESSVVAIGEQQSAAESQGGVAADNTDVTLDIVELPNADTDLSSQPALTLEQQKRQVKLAKQQAEMAAQQSQAKLEQIETSLAPDPLERESLAKVEVGYAIERWREAWATGDVQTYLRQYSPSFEPSNGLSVEEWEAQRLVRVTPSKQISLSLSNFDMSFGEQLSKAYVEFEQVYVSGAYSETSRKQLVLSKGTSGWKIVSEAELEQ